ncbi:MAG: amino acid permease [Polyangiaceae bacterium]|nr:amino acid permease [Polyangiaceae bacterium]
MGLSGATGVGVGAIVGGGILVLAGVAFRATGPSAILAFALNGVIAVITALSFAEMSSSFPESGGTYTFAKKVLNVRAAFAVGWILWFAYIVAGVLYALGFAEYAVAMAADVWRALGSTPPADLQSRRTVVALSLFATAAYTLALIRKSTGGGQWATIGKVVVFAVLIVAGGWAVTTHETTASMKADLTPFFPNGGSGLLAAMGFTFIALQGFDLIAAIAGEVKEPARVIPKAMLLSLGLALVIYLPLLFVVITAGTPLGKSIVAMSEDSPETVMAIAVKTFMGPVGYWLVMIAAVLSTLSALHANVLAASRVALTMATDRTLPRVFAQSHRTRKTPVMAIYASALALAAILMMVPDLAAAGAAASLIFLVSFALAHGTAILARRRGGAKKGGFTMPWYPWLPAFGGIACTGLAIFQAVAVPAAGAITGVWLGLGVLLYFALFAARAEAVDAGTQARDPELAKLRGRSPFVLVPVANPESAPALVELANSLAPSEFGRVLLLSVVRHKNGDDASPRELLAPAQTVLTEALASALAAGHRPEALLTHADAPWPEIARVVRSYRCESLLLGLPRLDKDETANELEQLLNDVECDVAVLRAVPGFNLAKVERVLVPIAGGGVQHELRARLLGSLSRGAVRRFTFLRVVPEGVSRSALREAKRQVQHLAEEEAHGTAEGVVVESNDVTQTVLDHAANADLLVLGLQRVGGRKAFGKVTRRIAAEPGCATIMLSRRG